MEYKETILGHEFVCKEEDLDKELKRIEVMYKLRNKNSAFLSLILLDNKEARKKVSSKIEQIIPQLYSYDIGCEEASMGEVDKLVKRQPVYLFNFEDYVSRYSEDRKVSYEDAQDACFLGINMARDGVFLAHKTTFIMTLNDSFYTKFMIEADDFFSYCSPRIDLNSCFVDKDGLNLSEFYKNGGKKIFIKK